MTKSNALTPSITGITSDYGEYAASQRCIMKEPKDRCKWLKENAGNYTKAQVKATEKVWGCRGSRNF